ncbi:MAG: hypothetical protein S4CHLAM102_14000 [Chlamydiia bacterium]|nr:hypothetical protein [Chlamydiia bacterium]
MSFGVRQVLEGHDGHLLPFHQEQDSGDTKPLPDEMLLMIFSCLDQEEKSRCLLVSKRWLRVLCSGAHREVNQLFHQHINPHLPPNCNVFFPPVSVEWIWNNYVHNCFNHHILGQGSPMSSLCAIYPPGVIWKPGIFLRNAAGIPLIEGLVRASNGTSKDIQDEMVRTAITLYFHLKLYPSALGHITQYLTGEEKDQWCTDLAEQALIHQQPTTFSLAVNHITDPKRLDIIRALEKFVKEEGVSRESVLEQFPRLTDPFIFDLVIENRVEAQLKRENFEEVKRLVQEISSKATRERVLIQCAEKLVKQEKFEQAQECLEKIETPAHREQVIVAIADGRAQRGDYQQGVEFWQELEWPQLQTGINRAICQTLYMQLGVLKAIEWIVAEADDPITGLLLRGLARQIIERGRFGELEPLYPHLTTDDRQTVGFWLIQYIDRQKCQKEILKQTERVIIHFPPCTRAAYQARKIALESEDDMERAIQLALESPTRDIVIQNLLPKVIDCLRDEDQVRLIGHIESVSCRTSAIISCVRDAIQRGLVIRAILWCQSLLPLTEQTQDHYAEASGIILQSAIGTPDFLRILDQLTVGEDLDLKDEMLENAAMSCYLDGKHTEALLLAEQIADEVLRMRSLYAILQHFWTNRLEGEEWPTGLPAVASIGGDYVVDEN